MSTSGGGTWGGGRRCSNSLICLSFGSETQSSVSRVCSVGPDQVGVSVEGLGERVHGGGSGRRDGFVRLVENRSWTVV